MLLEFQTLPQLAEVLAGFRQLHPARPLAEVAYDPPRENAAIFLDRARTRLAESPRDPLPLLVLRPVELPVEPLDDPARTEFRQALVDFWRAMNVRREAWGELPAQILLCVDPAHHERLVHLAADLRDWAMPKLHLRPEPEEAASRTGTLGAFACFSRSDIGPAAAAIQWQSLWPALEKVRQAGPLTSGHLRRYVFPLLEAALAQGNLVRARQVRAAAEGLCPGPADLVRWHELLARLAVGESDFAVAEQHARRLLELTEESRDRSARTSALRALIRVGNLLAGFGQAEAAEWLFLQTADRATTLLGPEHPDTLSSRNNLANTLRAQGKHAEAEREHRAVLAIRDRVLGPEHPGTLSSRNNLANALDGQGEHAEAEREQRAVLAIQERVLGLEHPETLVSRMNLANALRAQGKHAEAEREHRAARAIQERVLGPEHPDTLLSSANLAFTLQVQGKHQEAKPYAQRAYEIGRHVFGEQHPYIPRFKALWEQLQRAE